LFATGRIAGTKEQVIGIDTVETDGIQDIFCRFIVFYSLGQASLAIIGRLAHIFEPIAEGPT